MKMKFKKRIFLASLAVLCMLSACTANAVSKSENKQKKMEVKEMRIAKS